MAYFKCGNVSGNDDSMEWKLQGSVTGNSNLTLPTEYNELFITSYDKANRISVVVNIPYNHIQTLKSLDKVNNHRLIPDYNSDIYYNPTNDTIYLYNFRGNGVSNNSNYITYVYYR